MALRQAQRPKYFANILIMYKFYKYHGAGNDFLLADNRSGDLSLSPDQIRHLCARHTGFGADGVMLLENSDDSAFRMVFYNTDGSGGMMCGNGGRCIVAFAADLGIVNASDSVIFEAPDGLHQAEILPASAGRQSRQPLESVSDKPSRSLSLSKRPERIIRLKMKDVTQARCFPEDGTVFLDTGTRHLVKYVRHLDEYPVIEQGRILRNDPRFAPAGVNVDFVEWSNESGSETLRIRTFEKGVEDETLACGTGIVAAALTAYSGGHARKSPLDGRVSCKVSAAIATLTVDYVPEDRPDDQAFRDIWLTGPAGFIGTVEIML